MGTITTPLPITLQDCLRDAVTQLDCHLDNNDDPWKGDQRHMINELADDACPKGTNDILKIAIDSPEIGMEEPEHAAFDGAFTPVNVAAANIREAIALALQERINDREAEAEALPEEAADLKG